jgi:hypothetical protein
VRLPRERSLDRARRLLQQPDAEGADVRRRLRLRRDAFLAVADDAAASPAPASAAGPLPPYCLCENTGTLTGDFLEIAQSIATLRPPADWHIDQVHTTAEDLARRAAFMAEADDIDGRDLLFVGDDDFCSLLVCATGRPRRVVVVDIDERILATLSMTAAERGWPLETISWDLRQFVEQDPPEQLAGSFDVFVTDPPYSEAGMLLFTAFGVACLREGAGAAAYVAIPWLAREEWSNELLHRVQYALLDQGFFLSAVHPAFHAYDHLDGVYSTMLRAESYLREREPKRMLEAWQPDKLYSSRRWRR